MEFAEKIISWYQEHRRALPWRETKDPYKIWISETILQQTRISQGLPYYEKFIRLFPTPTALAQAPEDEVLKAWEGLGYYSRARNLQTAAREIVEKHGGVFPKEYTEVRALKGVGDYTAAAVCSLAYGQPKAVVDGNVYRVLSRHFAEETPIDTTQGKKLFAELAQELLAKKQSALYNQGMMDLGAMVCTPKNAQCEDCPISDSCESRDHQQWENLPVKSKKIAIKNRYFTYYYISTTDHHIVLHKRQGKDIWKGLWDLPQTESMDEPRNEEEGLKILKGSHGLKGVIVEKIGSEHTQQLTHQKLHARLIEMHCERITLCEGEITIAPEEIENYALPKLINALLKGKEG